MHIKEIQHHLTEEIDQLTFLKSRLSEEGEPLAADEKQKLRRVLANIWLPGMHQEAQAFFTNGSERDFIQSFEITLNALQQLM